MVLKMKDYKNSKKIYLYDSCIRIFAALYTILVAYINVKYFTFNMKFLIISYIILAAIGIGLHKYNRVHGYSMFIISIPFLILLLILRLKYNFFTNFSERRIENLYNFTMVFSLVQLAGVIDNIYHYYKKLKIEK